MFTLLLLRKSLVSSLCSLSIVDVVLRDAVLIIFQEKSQLFRYIFDPKNSKFQTSGRGQHEQTERIPKVITKDQVRNGDIFQIHSPGPQVQCWTYDMTGHTKQCVERYCELAKVRKETLRAVATPCMDDTQLSLEDFETKGHLSMIACNVVLKCLWVARLLSPYILWTVNTLAREITKWTVASDKRLHRLISYMHHTDDWVQFCYVGDPIKDIHLVMCPDASFAGDIRDSKSTSGEIYFLIGPSTCVPISWLVKKQGPVSHSSTEAEVVSLDTAVRLDGLPALILWDQVHEIFDNTVQAEAQCPFKGRYTKLESQKCILDFDVDYVPCNLPSWHGRARLCILEDNEATVKMLI